MRKLAFSMVLLACALFALPLTAQTRRAYQPPSKGELEQLRKDSAPELREVRGGKTSSEARLSSGERAQLEALKKAFPEEWNLLCDLRAGRHVHVDWWGSWGWYIMGPCISGTVVLLILILLLLLLW